MSNFLLTGGTGFLGKNLVNYLNNRGDTVHSFHSNFFDLANYDGKSEIKSCNVFDSGIKYDYIIHGAAVQAAGDWPLKHKAEQYDLNLRIHANTLKLWHKFQPQAKMIGIGSSCSYPGVKEVLKEIFFGCFFVLYIF